MIIESLELKNYRNYKELHINFDPGTNVLYGDNAQGKTNILESVYVCATTKSHRGSKDREIIEFGEEESHIKMNIRKDDVPYRIDMHLKKNKTKGVAINVHSLVQYNKIILQRNKLLKEIAFRPEYEEMLDIYDMQLVSYGRELIHYRNDFIDQMNGIIRDIHLNLSGGKEELEIRYEPNTEADVLEKALKKSRMQDLRQKTTLTGPHRDDISFYVNNIDIRKFGSQGQQRTAALSLKLAEIELVKKIVKDYPILLLDDVLSELDSGRQEHLLSGISHIQTVITCTGLDDFISHCFQIDKTFKVVNGTVDCE